MAKRFTSTEKWTDPWFRKLSPSFKTLWMFLLEQCDHAGIWKFDQDAFQYFIGCSFSKEEIFKALNDGKERVVSLNCGSKWLIQDFVTFQYGELSAGNRVHDSVISILKKEGAYKGLTSPLQGCKDMDKDKDKDIGGVGGMKSRFAEVWAKYPNKDGRNLAERSFKASVKTEQDFNDINLALENYLKSEKVQKGFVKNGSTWFNNWRDWVEVTPVMAGITPEKQAIDAKVKYQEFMKQVERRYQNNEINLQEKEKIIKEWKA